MSVSDAPLPSVLAFERGGTSFCCPVSDVAEIVEEPALGDPGYPVPLLAGTLLHRGLLIPAVDPVCVFDRPAAPRGDVILIAGPGGTVGLLSDRVLGFRTPSTVAPAPWVPAGRLCRRVAVIEGIGQAFLFGADGLADVPAVTAPPPATVHAADAATGGGIMHIVFTIDGRDYAAAYPEVGRILHRSRVFRVPGAVPPVSHAVEMIGAVVPAFDLSGAEEMPERGEFVVLTSPVGPLALRVDGIGRPLALTPDAGDPAWFAARGVAAVARVDDRPYAVVTGQALLRDLVGEPGSDGR